MPSPSASERQADASQTGYGTKVARPPNRWLSTRIPRVKGRERDAVGVPREQSLRVEGEHDLRASAARLELAVQSLPVASEEEHLVQESIP
ncbi:MAG: hypothetical protein WBV90_08110, partial [Terrimicrobiaceae bacterium]